MKIQLEKPLYIIILTIICSGFYYLSIITGFSYTIWHWFYNNTIGSQGLSFIMCNIILGLPILIGVFLIGPNQDVKTKLGLNGSIVTALIFAIVCVSPMYLGFSFLFSFISEFDFDVLDLLTVKAFSSPFFEELYFRAFLFGMIYKYTKLGFMPAVLLGSVLFGAAHLSQSTDPLELLGIFSITFLGAVIFSWSYAEWKFNIWIPIFLHMLMNLAWELFDVSDHALGDIYANIFRFVTVALIFTVTIIYKKKKDIPFEVNSSTIWIEKRKKA